MDNRINQPASKRVHAAARIRCEAEENALLCRPDHAMDAECRIADKLEESAFELLSSDMANAGVGGELVPLPTAHVMAAHYKDTMKTPSLVTAEASRKRLDLADEAQVLETALNLCETVQAENDAERMLAHQMALLHRLVMKTGARASETLERIEGIVQTRDREAGTVQLTRLINSVARASAEYQNCMLTLVRARSGGKQNITVTHIQNTQVNQGGKAVVTA